MDYNRDDLSQTVDVNYSMDDIGIIETATGQDEAHHG
jgi:hypothetical protein